MEEYVVRIYDGKNKMYEHRGVLRNHGFSFYKKQYGKSYYECVLKTENAVNTWKEYCKHFGLKIEVIPKQYLRDDEYRKRYFKENKPVVEAKYRCAYCGRQLSYKDSTVDHLFPVHKLTHRQDVRDMAALFGIHGANESKNLVCACRSCNSRKGTKMGLWIVRGMLGRHENFWRLVHLVYAVLGVAACYGVYRIYAYFGEGNNMLQIISNAFRW